MKDMGPRAGAMHSLGRKSAGYILALALLL